MNNFSGFIVPDELGYLAPIGLYKKQDVILQLPGSKSIFDIDWIAVYNRETRKSLGHVIVPESLNVPPSLVEAELVTMLISTIKSSLYKKTACCWKPVLLLK